MNDEDLYLTKWKVTEHLCSRVFCLFGWFFVYLSLTFIAIKCFPLQLLFLVKGSYILWQLPYNSLTTVPPVSDSIFKGGGARAFLPKSIFRLYQQPLKSQRFVLSLCNKRYQECFVYVKYILYVISLLLEELHGKNCETGRHITCF